MIRNVVIGIFILSLLALQSAAQNNFTKEQIRDFKEAGIYLNMNDYTNALNIYKRLYLTDSTNAELNYNIGYCIFQLRKNRLEALPYFKSSYKHGNTESSYNIAQCMHLNEKFDEAIRYYLIYKNSTNKKLISNSEIDRQIDISLRAALFTKNPVDVKIENIGNQINSEFPEYVPLINGKGDELIFTSRRKGSTGGLLDPYNQYFEDIYISRKKNNKWTTPIVLGESINTASHDACVGLSSNGKLLLIYRTNSGQTGGDLYWSVKDSNAWSSPIIFGPEINSEYQEPSATITNNGIVMYFSSNRPGGYGGKDIYRIVKFGNGDWSLPLNLGPTINTIYDDDAPFIHSDNKTLYFSSKGHNTIGGFDIFRSQLDESGQWSIPVNLGYPINTVDDDIYFSLACDNKTGYYSSDRLSGFGMQDIYILHLPDMKPNVLLVKGTVTNKKTEVINCKIRMTLIDEFSHTVQGIYKPNELTGKYIMIVSPDRKYKLIVEAENHLIYTETILLPKQESYREVMKNIRLTSLVPDATDNLLQQYKYTYTLENVYFDSEEHELLPSSYGSFQSLIKAMLNNKNMVVEIAGHTDNTGDENYNINLSQKRAESVKKYLISWGIEGNRLIAKGYGEKQNIASNDNEQGKALNRRTEIRVIKE